MSAVDNAYHIVTALLAFTIACIIVIIYLLYFSQSCNQLHQSWHCVAMKKNFLFSNVSFNFMLMIVYLTCLQIFELWKVRMQFQLLSSYFITIIVYIFWVNLQIAAKHAAVTRRQKNRCFDEELLNMKYVRCIRITKFTRNCVNHLLSLYILYFIWVKSIAWQWAFGFIFLWKQDCIFQFFLHILLGQSKLQNK